MLISTKIVPKHCCTCSIDALCKLKRWKILDIGEVMDRARLLITLVILSKNEYFRVSDESVSLNGGAYISASSRPITTFDSFNAH